MRPAVADLWIWAIGQTVRKYRNGKIIITPSAKNVKAFLTKIRQVIKGHKQAKANYLIGQLNPLIRGWANYHRHVSSKRTFAKIDHAIFQTLWRWARRRHPNKPRQWIKAKYFQSTDRRHWVFCGEARRWNGKTHRVQLCYAADVAIKRHIKIKGEANPYDPAWEMYFEHRLGVKMVDDLKGRRQLLHLWREQNGLCPVCQQIEAGELWIMDRNFCTKGCLWELHQRGAVGLIREHEQLRFNPLEAMRSIAEIDSGRVSEQRVRIDNPDGPGTLPLRRIRLQLNEPTREDTLYVLSTVPAEAADACDSTASAGRRRWPFCI